MSEYIPWIPPERKNIQNRQKWSQNRKKPGLVKKLSVQRNQEDERYALLTWDKVSGANVYKVRYYKDNDEYINYTTKNSLTLKNLKKGEGYSTRVEPMRQSESGFHVESNNAGEGKIYIE